MECLQLLQGHFAKPPEELLQERMQGGQDFYHAVVPDSLRTLQTIQGLGQYYHQWSISVTICPIYGSKEVGESIKGGSVVAAGCSSEISSA